MTRNPNRSVAVAGAPPPLDPEEVGVEVMESVVELELGEIDGDDMLGPRSKLPPVERVLPTQGWMRWWLGPNTRAEPPTPHSQIVFLIKKGGTSDYRVSSRDIIIQF